MLLHHYGMLQERLFFHDVAKLLYVNIMFMAICHRNASSYSHLNKHTSTPCFALLPWVVHFYYLIKTSNNAKRTRGTTQTLKMRT